MNILKFLMHSFSACTNLLHAKQEGSLYHSNDALWYDPARIETHDLPHERQTC